MSGAEHPSPDTVNVPLSGGRAYDIHLLRAGFSDGIDRLAGGGRRAVIVTQPRISERWAAPVIGALQAAGFAANIPIITFAAGERYKTMRTMASLCDRLYNLSPAVDRKTVLIALGGGVVGDAAGFLAAIYLRGLDYIQVPTTLLAMVDSSVGGKTGVDFRAGKNLIGAFHQPRAVLIAPETLSTLPAREMRAGMAEVIKYGVIRDPAILREVAALPACIFRNPANVSDNEGASALIPLIRKSCEIKASVIVQDEYELTGQRAALNFGHTVGHALESATGYRRYRHGEAVAIGMIAAAAIGEAHGVTASGVRSAIADALRAAGLPTALPNDVTDDDLIGLLGRDKKAVAGRAKFVLARSLGDAALYDDVEERTIRAGLLHARTSQS